MLGLHYWAPAFVSCGGRGYSPAGLHWFRTFSSAAGLVGQAEAAVTEHGAREAGSAVAVQGLRCPETRGIFLDQGSNPRPLHWREDSSPLDHQGGPRQSFENMDPRKKITLKKRSR